MTLEVDPEALVAARRRAQNLYRSAGLRSTYVKGAYARLVGRDSSACPYAREDAQTWRTTYRLAWMRGHGSVPDPTEG